jgi:UDP-glucose 4-epimerase
MFIIHGGSGFIGQHVRSRLAALHIPCVYVGRRQLEGQPVLSDREEYMRADAFEGAAGDELITRGDVFVYLVTGSVPGTFADRPWEEVNANVQHAFKVFYRVAALNPKLKIVFVSSGGTVYGSQPNRLTNEDTPLGPMSGYGVGKVMTEEALRFIGRTMGVAVAVLRVSNPVGVYQASSKQGIVTIALRAAHAGTPVMLFGDGLQVRDYVDADDVADAIIRAGTDRDHMSGTWNIGSGEGYSVLEMFRAVEDVTGRRLMLERRPGRLVDIPYIVLDISRAGEQLGWRPSRRVGETIKLVHQALLREVVLA